MSSGTITLLGLTVVFSALAILYFSFILLGKIFSGNKKIIAKKVVKIPEPAKATVEPGAVAEESTENPPVVAISAAIAAVLGEGTGFSIRSIEPAGVQTAEKRSLWRSRQPQVYWQPRRNK